MRIGQNRQNRQVHLYGMDKRGLGRIIEPKHKLEEKAEITCVERLGGLLKSYHRLAA